MLKLTVCIEHPICLIINLKLVPFIFSNIQENEIIFEMELFSMRPPHTQASGDGVSSARVLMLSMLLPSKETSLFLALLFCWQCSSQPSPIFFYLILQISTMTISLLPDLIAPWTTPHYSTIGAM